MSKSINQLRTISKALQLSTLAALVIFGSWGCSSKHKAEKIDTEINHEGKITGDTSVGVKDGNMVVQKKVEMNEEVRRLQYEVYELEDRVYGNENLDLWAFMEF